MAQSGSADGKRAIECSVFSCEDVYDPRTDISRLKHLSRFKVALIMSGSGILRVLDKEIPCSAGDICILPSDLGHGFFLQSPNDSLTVRQIEFDPRDWFSGGAAMKDLPEYCYGVFEDDRLIAYAPLTSYMLERIYTLFDYIECETLEMKEGWRTLISGYLENLFIHVARYVNSAIKNTVNISRREWDVVLATMNAVKEQYSDSTLTLRRIATALYMSESQLSRIFKRTAGVSFSDYLRQVRMNEAARLLKSRSTTVTEAARLCGFRDMNTFYKLFYEFFGTTPKNYRHLQDKTEHGSIKNKNKTNEEKIMVILSDISENLQKGKAKIVKELVEQAIDEGANPAEILNEGLLAGMNVVGEKFKNNEIYVPEVLVAARAMNAGAQILKPYLAEAGVAATGKVCIGTVQGDLHDIGKNLVKMMMEGKGLEVIDLGTDVSPETFVNTAINEGCQIICCSALLTTTMPVMADVVKAAEAAGIRDKVKIMIGGAPINEEYCREIGADCYTLDAASAADAAVALCKG